MLADQLGGVTAQMLTAGLNAAVARHQGIAHNIANANSPGYVAQEMNFSRLFEWAYSEHARGTGAAGAAAWPAGGLPASSSAADGGPVQLDVELAKLSDNVLRYQTLLRGLDRHLGNLAYVIADGRK